jgi:hypothetical protein
MSKLKNMSRAGWIIIGLVAALVLVPTAAVAATATLGKIDATSGNKADVTEAGSYSPRRHSRRIFSQVTTSSSEQWARVK